MDGTSSCSKPPTRSVGPAEGLRGQAAWWAEPRSAADTYTRHFFSRPGTALVVRSVAEE